MLTLIAYDVIEDKRRVRIAKILEDYGDRVQYSVFEALLKKKEIAEMTQRVEKEIEPEEDSIRIYQLCRGCESRIETLGQGERTIIEDAYIL